MVGGRASVDSSIRVFGLEALLPNHSACLTLPSMHEVGPSNYRSLLGIGQKSANENLDE